MKKASDNIIKKAKALERNQDKKQKKIKRTTNMKIRMSVEIRQKWGMKYASDENITPKNFRLLAAQCKSAKRSKWLC